MNLDNIIKKNNELLKEAHKSAIITRGKLELELIDNYSDELFNKIVYLNNEIDKASKLIDCTPSEGHKIYCKEHPKNVDQNGNLNDKGKKRFNFLRKRFGFIRLFK